MINSLTGKVVSLISTMEEIKKDEDSESIYINLEDKESAGQCEVYENFCPSSAAPNSGSEAASEVRQVCSGNPAAVCLGLLCVLLLAVIMALSIKHSAERDQLWRSYTNMTMERDQLQTSFDNLTMERDGLQRTLSHIDTFCPYGWTRFKCSCYYISIFKSTWDQSRKDCREKGADLVIINSKEEQTFVSGLESNFWIGLNDREHEGHWKWVDSTLLYSGYWIGGKPNNYIHWNSGYSRQVWCVQRASGGYNPLSNWKTVRCDTQCFWICEKKIQCLT